LYKKYIKRIMDILCAMIFSVIVLPFLGICILIIRLEDRGPLFYCGTRLGKGGRVFTMYKIRTMKVNSPDIRNADGSTFNSYNDPRLTHIGKILRKTSLDLYYFWRFFTNYM